MATYVNNLRLKEITTGDEDGTWGTSTNTNLELIGEALGYGTKQMAADADETFTMPDASADGTRSFYLKITSGASLTTTRVVTLGPNTVSKFWIIENATSGGQVITIKQGSGATVNIDNGDKVYLYTDGAGSGAAVVNANPSGATGGTVTSVGGTGSVNGITLTGTVTSSGNLTLGGTLANVDLTSQVTGTLPIANGGTGTTSTTFVNLATNVSGVLPFANGGTGLSSLGSAGQVLSVNTGGTALEYAAVSAGKASMTANGAVTAGDRVSTNADGTVSTVAGLTRAASVGTAAAWESTDTPDSYFAVAYDTTANKGIITFQNASSSKYEALVVTNSSGSLSYGTVVEVGDSGANAAITYNLGQDAFVAVWRDGSAGHIYARAGEVVGTVTSWGTAVSIDTNNPNDSLNIATIPGTNNVLVSFDDGSQIVTKTLTLSGTAITVNAAVNTTGDRNNGGRDALKYNSDGGYFALAYQDSNNRPSVRKITVSGTVPTVGAKNELSTDTTGTANIEYNPTSKSWLYVYNVPRDTNNLGTKYFPVFLELLESGGTFTKFKTASGAAISADVNNQLYMDDPEVFLFYDSTSTNVLALQTQYNTNGTQANVGYTVSQRGSQITISDLQYFPYNGDGNKRFNAYFDPDETEFVVFYKEPTSDDGQAQVFTPAVNYTTRDAYFGIAAASISDGASGDITIIGGLNTSVSSLVAGEFYYLSTTGALTTTSNGFPVGTALSTTSILLNNVGYNALPDQTLNDGKFLSTDGLNTSWLEIYQPGGLPDGSAVAASGDTYPTKPASTLNYTAFISNDNANYMCGADSHANAALDNGAGIARGFLTPRYSSYWNKWFAITKGTDGGFQESGATLVCSANGVDWFSVGELRSFTGNNSIDKWSTDDLRRPQFCFDESNGRLFIGLTESSGSYRLKMAYFNLAGGTSGTVITGSDTGNQSSQILDWEWCAPLNQIIICYTNNSGQFNGATISAGSTSISQRFSQSFGSGSNKRWQMLWTNPAGTSNLYWYFQNDDQTAYYAENSSFPTSLTQVSSQGRQMSENYLPDMSPKYLVLPDGSNVYIKAVENGDWKGTSWDQISLGNAGGGSMYMVRYNPVKDEWIGLGNGYAWYSKTGKEWIRQGRIGDYPQSRAYMSLKTTGEYPY